MNFILFFMQSILVYCRDDSDWANPIDRTWVCNAQWPMANLPCPRASVCMRASMYVCAAMPLCVCVVRVCCNARMRVVAFWTCVACLCARAFYRCL